VPGEGADRSEQRILLFSFGRLPAEGRNWPGWPGPLLLPRPLPDRKGGSLTNLVDLLPEERRVLATLAVVGRASLSVDELADLNDVVDVIPIITSLEQRGLIASDEKQRYSAIGHVAAEIRRTDDALSSGDRLFGYFSTLARSGGLMPERLADDTEAIFGLCEWAAEAQRWDRLLELVKTLHASYEIGRRTEEWIALLHRARGAAHTLGDQRSEIWVLEQLSAASTALGDPAGATEFRRAADELRGTTATIGRPPRSAGQTVLRIALFAVGALIIAAGGIGVGYAIGNGGSSPTAPSVTVTLSGTGSLQTVTETTTVETTATVESTTTVFVTTSGTVPTVIP
jgi:hypothetical protein